MAVKIQYRKKKSWTLDTLYNLPLDNPLSGSLSNQLQNVSDLKEICAQSWGHIEAFRDL